MAKRKPKKTQTRIDNKPHEELVFLAQDAVDNIRHAKDASRYILSAYTAAFGFMWTVNPKDSFLLHFIFYASGILVFIFCGIFIPDKLYERRSCLYKVFSSSRFSDIFRKIYGKDRLKKLRDPDAGDNFYVIFSFLYPIFLMLAFYEK